MPPSMSHGPLTLLPRCRASASTTRAFSTSTSLLRIGPESPRYVEVPKIKQPAASFPRNVRGKLPVPRDLFPARSADKTSAEYFAATTPEPSQKHTIEAAPNDYAAWKRKLALMRREHLRESLQALHARKVKTQQRMAAKSSKKQTKRNALLNRPPRDDEYLTASTIRAYNKLKQSGPLPDPDREERLLQKTENFEAHAASKSELRCEALHALYVDAHSFITTMADLDAQINEQFTPDKFSSVRPGARSVWDAYGAQPTVKDLLAQIGGRDERGPRGGRSTPSTLNNARVRKIAEELTGGRMAT